MRLSWRQQTPLAQLIVLRSSIEGHFDNWCSGVIDTNKFREKITQFLEEMEELEFYLDKGGWS